METLEHGDNYIVWSKSSLDTSRYNVATGASITGAARSILLRGIATAKQPLYCDTDSIICKDLPLAKKDATELGAWKIEAEFDSAAIAGRKLYALFESRKENIKKLRDKANDKKKFDKSIGSDGSLCVKQANKGVAVSAIDIWNVCCGDVIVSNRDAPSYKLDGSHNFISRRVRMTA